MAGSRHRASGPRTEGIAFAAGLLTSVLIFSMIIAFLVQRIGPSTVARRIGLKFTALVLDMPDRVIDELRSAGGVVDNAFNPTGAKKHGTFVVEPDPELVYKLKPGVEAESYVLKARGPMNLDPPVAYLEPGDWASAELRGYLDERTRVRFSFSVDAKGFRRTVPAIESDRRILMVGDSALFGTGVDDEQTIASHLQSLVGSSYQVVNAGVGGYSGFQAFQMAQKLAREDDYEVLVYSAHHNDFFESRHISSPELARETLARFESLKGEFPKGVIVSLVTYLHYAARETLLEQGWGPDRIESTDVLRRDLPGIAAAMGFEFIDFTDDVEASVQRDGTIFSPFALYCDRAHLSPRGTRLMAQRIFEVFRGMTE